MTYFILSTSFWNISSVFPHFIKGNCVSLFVTVNKTPERNNLREEGFILVHSFGGFSPCAIDYISFGPVARQKHQAGGTWWRKAAHIMTVRKQRDRQEGVTQEGVENKIPFQYTPLVTYFL
jgi:hypothetical protein